MFRKTPFILLVVIVFTLLLTPLASLEVKQALYAMSLSIKEIIVFILPLIIFGLLFKAASTLADRATKLIGVILIAVCCSNFFSTFLSHYIGIWIYQFDLSMIVPSQQNGLKTLWTWSLPKWIANSHAMFAGIVLGIFSTKISPLVTARVAACMESMINKILQAILYIIPLFVAGFIVKLQEDGIVGTIIKDYTSVFLCVVLTLITYLSCMYFVLHKFNKKSFISHFKNILPAAMSGFSTMSSAASMPLTIIGTENSVKNKYLARSVIPATVNIHLIGDCIAIPIFAYAVLKSFGMPAPSLISYLIFTCYFVLAKFSVAAVPGGGILIMLPILENYLGFNAEMLSLMTALYFLFDPIVTCANVMGNSAFAKAIDHGIVFLDRRKNKTNIPDLGS